MSRIERRFTALRQEGRAGLVTYLTAGDPDPGTSARLFGALAAAGADLIEIGMPFSDPMADGPVIQEAGQRALKAGMSLRRTLALVRELRRGDGATPIVLMGYYNPIYRYGPENFAQDAVAAATGPRPLRPEGRRGPTSNTVIAAITAGRRGDRRRRRCPCRRGRTCS